MTSIEQLIIRVDSQSKGLVLAEIVLGPGVNVLSLTIESDSCLATGVVMREKLMYSW